MDCADGDFINDNMDDEDYKGYNSDGTDDTATEDTSNCYTTKVNEFRKPVPKHATKHETQELDEFGDPVREYKAL